VAQSVAIHAAELASTATPPTAAESYIVCACTVGIDTIEPLDGSDGVHSVADITFTHYRSIDVVSCSPGVLTTMRTIWPS
jgi:hypothetical protein